MLAASIAPWPAPFNLANYFLFDRLSDGLEGKRAIQFGDRSYTYGETAELTRHLMTFLAQSVRPGERVLIALPDSPAFAVGIFAGFGVGAIVAMGNPDAPTADLEYLVRYARPTAVITLARAIDSIKAALVNADVKQVIVVPEVPTGGDVFERLALPPEAAAPSPVTITNLGDAIHTARWLTQVSVHPSQRDDLAMWLFTSGSTGKSKAAMHCHRDFAFNTERYALGTVGYRKDDITVSVPRLFFGYATGTNLFFPFRVGATVGLFSERPTPETLSHYVKQYRATIVTNVPTLMGKLLEYDDGLVASGDASSRPDFSTVRFQLSAGEALPKPLLERFQERFTKDVYDGIGSAEMFHIYCTNRPGDIKPGSLGRVVEGYTIKILSSDATAPGEPELPAGETGVMWVSGESVALGYHQDREKSWHTFHGKWCKTGDLFRVDEQGYLWFSGRADDLLKVGGLWVAPVEVEEALLNHPSVLSAAVIGSAEADLIKPKAVVVLLEPSQASAKLARELQEHVQSKLSKHKYPRWVVFVTDLPKNDRGKVDKKELKERDARGELRETHV